ncbi:uncharacterized protein LOC128614256 [Ictalurus furcatus]|uniref:uncharacterized protein LOC128614256 n=1 Tax=Ictalurus furcatus TaxID=66913 RepID=UPI00235077C5|nr:uncharacterized protein LOC128614256 [Ictalurus furcatus]XP_053491623.1 uncharacterized protein LOC128614256 [Ictalurus furcatus]
MLNSPVDHMPHPEGEPPVHPCRPEEDSGIFQSYDNYVPDKENISFPGPLLSSKMQMEDLIHFIQRKSQECLQHVDKPEQKEAYFFWSIMELLCSKNGNVLLAEVAVILFKGYGLLREKLRGGKHQDGWCLALAQLLCSADSEEEHLSAVVDMGKKLDSEGLTYAAHICYVVALEELEICQGYSFDLIGCKCLPVSQSALREAIEQTEVYEYVCSLTSGFAQPNFQIYKFYHANRLAESGHFDQAIEYCKTIATAIAKFPYEITKTTMELTIALSERLHVGKGEAPEWLLNLRQLHRHRVFKPKDSEWGLLNSEMFAVQFPCLEHHITPWEVVESLYTTRELLGEGGFGTVCAGVRKADGKQVAIKYVDKSRHGTVITIPGETRSLPLEVALMEMVSKPFHCENVLELIEWFEMSECYILILERPSPCMNLCQFTKSQSHKGRLSEPLAQKIMRQVVQAARHCCDCGVLHRDIKGENILINTDTLQVKLIDFGCGDLLKNTPYKIYTGTRVFYPPEWVCEGEYFGRPATIWSLGVLLFHLVCGDLPFQNEVDIVDLNIRFTPGLSRACRDLIFWCLERHPHYRPTFQEILSHEWFTEPQNRSEDPCCEQRSGLTPLHSQLNEQINK